MHHKVDKILSKPSDYKCCSECGNINWYENHFCRYCKSIKFEKIAKSILICIKEIYLPYDFLEV